MNCQVICAVFLISVAVVAAGPVVDDHKASHANAIHSNEISTEETLLKKLKTKCYNGDFSPCMIFLAVSYFNDMLKKPQADFGSVEITKNTNSIIPETSRSLKDMEHLSDEAKISQLMADKLYNYVKSRSMKWHVTDDADLVVSGRSDASGGLNLGISLQPNGATEEGRKKKDQGGNMNGLIAAAIMKIGLLKALAFKALVLLVGKAVIVSKLALVLAVIIGLKKLFSQDKHVTYEVVAQPHHDHHEHHEHISSGGHDSYGGGGGWGRNFDAKSAQEMAYRAQIPAN
ncbi:uncharacterized protein LOC115880980 [Sitophilus oryzae]|uniref:Uncharacterized protein LOC115880980 n=1 Tax=Sitophilus oryzae TaxID=7048 RepID=A0A6J2XTP8_SITOR|nr:uncharacterized protein LOC115880980 [Sitophilus oryzae]